MAERRVRIVIEAGGNAAVEITTVNSALRNTQSQAVATSSAMNLFKGALGALGVQLTAQAAVNLTKDLYNQGIAWQSAQAAVEATTGSLDAANEAIADAQAATEGLVSRTNSAVAVNVFLRNGLASTGAEAGKLAQAGQILSSVYEAQGATFEKYVRFISTGNIALADNFNLTMGQINSLSKQIQSTEGLTKAEADLEARKRLLIQAADEFNETMPEAVRASTEFNAAVSDLAASFGNELTPAVAESLGPLTDIVDKLNEAHAPAVSTAAAIALLTGNYADYASALGESYEAGRGQEDVIRKSHDENVRFAYAITRVSENLYEQTDAAVKATESQLSLQAAYVGASRAASAAVTAGNAAIVQARQSLNATLESLNRQQENAERSHATAVASIQAQIAEASNRGIEDRQRQLYDNLRSMAEQHANTIRNIQAQIASSQDDYNLRMQDRAADFQDKVTEFTENHQDKKEGLLRDYNRLQQRLDEETDESKKEHLRQQLADVTDRLAEEDASYNEQLARMQEREETETARAKRDQERRVAALKERIAEEDKEYEKQRARAQAAAEEDMGRIRAENAQRVAELQKRLDEENAAYARQQADIKRSRDEANAQFMRILAEQNATIAEAQEKARVARDAWLRDTQAALQRVRDWWKNVENAANAAQQAAAQTAGAGAWGGWSGVTGYQMGTPYVPQTGLALLHQGEAVIPANQNRGGMGGLVVNFTYAPTVSLGDKYEAEQVITPLVVSAIRRSLSNYGAI